jgi:hypothetical protein
MAFRFIHNKDGISLFDIYLDKGVVISLEEFKEYLLDYELPLSMVEKHYTKFKDGTKQHYLVDTEGVVYHQDDWENGEYIQSILPQIITDKVTKQNKVLDLIKDQIQQRQNFNSEYIPLGTKVLSELNNENLLQLILDKGDLRSFIGVLIYTILIPNESLAIDYLKKTVESNFNQTEINKIVEVITKIIK